MRTKKEAKAVIGKKLVDVTFRRFLKYLWREIQRRTAAAPAEPDWDPTGDEPPPVELPLGMFWRKSTTFGDWIVSSCSEVGFITSRFVLRRWSASVQIPAFRGNTIHPTALEAARALAASLRGTLPK